MFFRDLMVKNLLTRIGFTAVVILSPILYAGCSEPGSYVVKPTTYQEKWDVVESQLEQNRRTGNQDVGAIVPLLKLTSKK